MSRLLPEKLSQEEILFLYEALNETIAVFSDFIENNIDEIDAKNIFGNIEDAVRSLDEKIMCEEFDFTNVIRFRRPQQ